MRSSRVLFQSISRMLDMGGMPSASTSKAVRAIDASKNCKVKGIAFDFDLLTRTVQKPKNETTIATPATPPTLSSSSVTALPMSSIQPNVGMIQEMANLLKVQLGGSVASNVPVQDDLSALFEKDNATITDTDTDTLSSSHHKNNNKKIGSKLSNALDSMDVRNKYASKLRHRLEGGVAGIELAKQQAEDAMRKGDAGGHLAARAMAVESGGAKETKWMAMTGTGALLHYISNRSLKIALLPKPHNEAAETEGKRMQDFSKQLPMVSFDLLLKEGDDVQSLLGDVVQGLSTDPLSILVVSDRDDYLRQAKEVGMTTCRVRPNTNSPRGNVSAHYNVTSMAEVEDVVNEINGISFNAVFKAR